jgi:hypothetical protein
MCFSFYLNELLILFWEDSVHLSRTALASFFCYLALVNLGYNAIKTKKLYTTKRIFTFYTSYELRVLIAYIF